MTPLPLNPSSSRPRLFLPGPGGTIMEHLFHWEGTSKRDLAARFPASYNTGQSAPRTGIALSPTGVPDYRSIKCDACGVESHGDLGRVAHDIPRHADFLLIWLYYGLLHAFCSALGVPFRQEHFVSQDPDGRRVLTTRNIHQYIWYWAAASVHSPPRHVDLGHIISVVRLNVGIFIDCDASAAPDVAGHPVLAAISVLGATLDHVHAFLFGSSSSTDAWKTPLALRRLLQEAGWCPGQVAHFTRTLSPTTLALIAFQGEPADRDKNHDSCTEQHCYAHQVDPARYKTAHAGRDCRCEHHYQDPDINQQVREILLQDRNEGVAGIPVFAVTRWPEGTDKAGELRVIVRDALAKPRPAKFVAISHVWSDGMGNAQENTMPACLWQHLQRRVQRLYPNKSKPVPFWIDTVGVPMEPSLRRRAIADMSALYGRASKVLVMDKSMQRLSGESRSPLEMLFSVGISPWNRRLWTFPEAALAKVLCFDFEDEPRDATQLLNDCSQSQLPTMPDKAGILDADMDSCWDDEYTPFREKLRRALAGRMDERNPEFETTHLFAMYADMDQQFPTAEDEALWTLLSRHQDVDPILYDLSHPVRSHWVNVRINKTTARSVSMLAITKKTHRHDAAGCGTVLAGIQGRTTSRSEDEALCIASTLGVDVSAMLQVATKEERMIVLLQTLEYIPRSVLFTPFKRSFPAPFRWAPQSFLDAGRNAHLQDDRKKARVIDDGLVTLAPGFELTVDWDSMPDDDSGAYKYFSTGDATMRIELGRPGEQPRTAWRDYVSKLDLMIIIPRMPERGLQDEPAALVAGQGVELDSDGESVYCVEYLAYAETRFYSHDEEEHHGQAELLERCEKQKWCVS